MPAFAGPDASLSGKKIRIILSVEGVEPNFVGEVESYTEALLTVRVEESGRIRVIPWSSIAYVEILDK